MDSILTSAPPFLSSFIYSHLLAACHPAGRASQFFQEGLIYALCFNLTIRNHLSKNINIENKAKPTKTIARCFCRLPLVHSIRFHFISPLICLRNGGLQWDFIQKTGFHFTFNRLSKMKLPTLSVGECVDCSHTTGGSGKWSSTWQDCLVDLLRLTICRPHDQASRLLGVNPTEMHKHVY